MVSALMNPEHDTPRDLSSEVVVRWKDYDANVIPLLKEGGITTVLVQDRNEAFESACRSAGLKIQAREEIQDLPLEFLKSVPPKALVALTEGLWPGVGRPGMESDDAFTTGATGRPWVNANAHWFGILRCLYPNRAALLGYLPDEKAGVKPELLVPYDSLELALIEAKANGGNYLLTLEPRYHEKLLGGDAKALEAWRQMGRTVKWLSRNADLFRQPVLPTVTALVEPDQGSAEIVNLLYRQCASPALAKAATPPAPDPQRCRALVAAGIEAPSGEVRRRILSHAVAGASVLVDAPDAKAWWRDPQLKLVRSQEDREFYALGRGQVVAYKEAISDPGEFAYDVIDIVTQKRRAVRLWNAPAVIPLTTSSPPGGNRGRTLVRLVNYGAPTNSVLLGTYGLYTKATLLRPGADPLQLPTTKVGPTTEVTIPELGRVGVLMLG
jgi:hypothetical protein